jgi:hypothetical protein
MLKDKQIASVENKILRKIFVLLQVQGGDYTEIMKNFFMLPSVVTW